MAVATAQYIKCNECCDYCLDFIAHNTETEVARLLQLATLSNHESSFWVLLTGELNWYGQNTLGVGTAGWVDDKWLCMMSDCEWWVSDCGWWVNGMIVWMMSDGWWWMIVTMDDVLVVWQVGADLMQPIVELILFFLQCGSDHTTLSFYPGDTYLHATAILTFMNGRYPFSCSVALTTQRSFYPGYTPLPFSPFHFRGFSLDRTVSVCADKSIVWNCRMLSWAFWLAALILNKKSVLNQHCFVCLCVWGVGS